MSASEPRERLQDLIHRVWKLADRRAGSVVGPEGDQEHVGLGIHDVWHAAQRVPKGLPASPQVHDRDLQAGVRLLQKGAQLPRILVELRHMEPGG